MSSQWRSRKVVILGSSRQSQAGVARSVRHLRGNTRFGAHRAGRGERTRVHTLWGRKPLRGRSVLKNKIS